MMSPNPNLADHLMRTSDMSFTAPQQKGFLQKKVLPVIRRVGVAAGRVSDVAGKVAVIASII